MNPSSQKKKEPSRSLLYRVLAWLHLWLGLATGIVVVIVCLTGCIWVFNDEIKSLLEPEFNIGKQDTPLIKPSALKAYFGKKYKGKSISFITYRQDQAISVNMGERKRGAGGLTARVNPYTGEVIKIIKRTKGETDFFRFILNGHRFLWLPYEIGRPIVNYSVLTFVFILITGLVLWWPKNKAATKQRVMFKWKETTRWKRKNYDLHNILGFYAMIFLLAIAMTGMVWGINWYSESLYWATSGGKSLPNDKEAISDTLQLDKFYTPDQALDLAWNTVISNNPKAEGFSVNMPDLKKAKSTIRITAYPDQGQFYKTKGYIFDRHTLKELPGHPVYDKSIAESDFGGALRKMNYDIHVGSILGFPGKVLAFLSSLIGASLPVTGFYIWWNKKKNGKKEQKVIKKENAVQLSKVNYKPALKKPTQQTSPVKMPEKQTENQL